MGGSARTSSAVHRARTSPARRARDRSRESGRSERASETRRGGRGMTRATRAFVKRHLDLDDATHPRRSARSRRNSGSSRCRPSRRGIRSESSSPRCRSSRTTCSSSRSSPSWTRTRRRTTRRRRRRERCRCRFFRSRSRRPAPATTPSRRFDRARRRIPGGRARRRARRGARSTRSRATRTSRARPLPCGESAEGLTRHIHLKKVY